MNRPDYVPENISDDDLTFMRACGVIREDDSFDQAQACRELADFRTIMREASKVYERLAGVSKPNTRAEEVIRLAEASEQDECDEAINEATQELREELAAATEALISFHAGESNPEAQTIYAGWKADADRLISLRTFSRFPQLLERIRDARINSRGHASVAYRKLLQLLLRDEHV